MHCNVVLGFCRCVRSMRRCSHSAPTSLASAAVADAARGEDRRRIARPERFEPFQLAAECGRDLREEQFGVDVHLRNEHLRIDVLFDVGVEPPRELPDVLRPHREPCGVHVPAEVFQQVGARLHGLIEVEARSRTAEPVAKPLLCVRTTVGGSRSRSGATRRCRRCPFIHLGL